jgi:phage baseplate assembly protein W
MARPRWYGYNFPFFGGNQNVLSRQVNERLIKNDLNQLLLTVPGERVFRPDFGVNLRNAVFDLLDATTTTPLRNEIFEKIRRFEKRVTVTEVLVEPDDTRLLLEIKVFGTINIGRDEAQGSGQPEEADLLLSLKLTNSRSIARVA